MVKNNWLSLMPGQLRDIKYLSIIKAFQKCQNLTVQDRDNHFVAFKRSWVWRSTLNVVFKSTTSVCHNMFGEVFSCFLQLSQNWKQNNNTRLKWGRIGSETCSHGLSVCVQTVCNHPHSTLFEREEDTTPQAYWRPFLSQAQEKYSSNRRGEMGLLKKMTFHPSIKLFLCVRKSHFFPGRMALKQDEPSDSKNKK